MRCKFNIVILIGSVGLSLLFLSCENLFTRNSETEPGPRSYVWEIDTLHNTAMNYIHAIWGASPDDIWVVGAGGTYSDRLLHYDGNEWTTYTDVPIFCFADAIFGFAADHIWMGGSAGFTEDPGASIWHYDGNEWSANYIHDIGPGADINDIWGNSPDDIYACGHFNHESVDNNWGGFVLHYDGDAWTELVRTKYRAHNPTEFMEVKGEKDHVYVWDFRTSRDGTGIDTVAFHELKGNQLHEIYAEARSNIGGNIGWGGFHLIDEKLYFYLGFDVFLYRSGKFVKQFSLDHPNYWGLSGGRNEKDVFLGMDDGLAHYNGTDIEYLFRYPWKGAYRIMGRPMIFEKEVFFCMEGSAGGFWN